MGDSGNHVTPEELADLEAGRSRRKALRALVEHLLSGCTVCRERLEPTLFPARLEALQAAGVDPYELPLARAFAFGRRWMAERTARQEAMKRNVARILVWGDASPAPPEAQPERLEPARPGSVTARRRWAYCEDLLELAAERRREAPAEALEHAERAIQAAESLDPGAYPEAQLAGLQARTWMGYGNLLRVLERLDAAEAAFQRSFSLLPQALDPLLVARFLDLVGSLRRDQRLLPEAIEALDRAADTYRSYGAPHLAGRSLLKAGLAASYAGDPETALGYYDRALDLLDPKREPALLLALAHNTLLAQAETGQAKEAARILWRVRPMYEQHGSETDKVRLLALEGKIAVALGHLDRAERSFRDAMAGFEQAGLLYVASIAALELSAVLLERRRPEEVLGLVKRMLVIFGQLRIEREALAAVLVLQKALAQGTATAELAREVAAKLSYLGLRPGDVAKP